jgi:hypothetical protein
VCRERELLLSKVQILVPLRDVPKGMRLVEADPPVKCAESEGISACEFDEERERERDGGIRICTNIANGRVGSAATTFKVWTAIAESWKSVQFASGRSWHVASQPGTPFRVSLMKICPGIEVIFI